LAQLTDGQLQAYARTVKDAVALAEVKSEMARRAGVRQPQGEAPTQTVAQEIAGQGGEEQPIMAAGGGIVALAGGSQEPVKDDNSLTAEDIVRLGPGAAAYQARRDKEMAERVVPVGMTNIAANPVLLPAGSVDVRAIPQRSGILAANSAPLSGAPERYIAEQNARLIKEAGQAEQAQNADSQVQPSEALQYPNTFRAELEEANQNAQMQDADSQVQPRGGIAAIPPVSSAIAGATPRTPVATGAPTGGGITSVAPNVPAGGAPAVSGAGAGTIGNAPVAAIGKGAVPVGNPNDMSWGAFAANVKAASQLEPEDKALLADMQKRADRRLARAEGQEKNVLNEALISGGLAMMGGLNLSDGVKRMAEAGGKQYFASKAEASKAINAAEDAQDAFNQYQMSYKQGNKKMIGEMYGKWQSSMLDFQGKIQTAAMTSGASLENARATREATAEARRQSIEQHALDRDEKIRQFDLSLKQNENQFVTRMKELGNQQAITSFEQLDRTFKDTMAAKETAQAKVYAEFKPRFERFTLMDLAKMSDADKKQYNALNTEYKAAMLSRLTPWDDQLEQVQNRKAAMMGIRPIGSAGGTNSQFKVVGVE
jgi:hypothetical protein